MTNVNDFTAYGYEVIKELGANRGAGRIAYLVREIDSEQLVVIKQFQFAQTGSSWDGHKEIDREVKILQQLKHPNIPRYLTSFETPQSSCIVQEYIDGKPLSEIISNQQLYTPEQVKEIILKLLEVLVYLQKTFTDPVLHRDIKPANILIDSSCQPYLIDFGGAKVSEGSGGSTVSVGTLGFMPPEQRFQQFNKTTDIYSLGMSIVCWLTRTESTEMYNIINMGTNQVMGLRELLSAYSLRFVDWLEKVVQPDSKDRYPDAEAALDAFNPLYVKRVPEAIVSSSVLEFTASKLGERITQTLTVRNNVPETVLEGWWEVAPHPSDPPHTPNSHAWISFGSRKFSGNAHECSIVVNTSKLMAGKVYERQILLHSNSSEEIEKLNLVIITSEFPRTVNLPYQKLLLLLFLIGGITLILKVENGKLAVSIAALVLLFAMIFVVVLVCCSWCLMFAGSSYIIPATLIITTAIVCSRVGFSAIVPFSMFLIIVILTYKAFKLIKDILNQPNSGSYSLLKNLILSVVFPGAFIPFAFSVSSPALVILGVFTALTPLTFILSLTAAKHQKLVSKYRNSEKGLIRP
jgi:serine/threonine protein kinase